jgi:hypothetical protein
MIMAFKLSKGRGNLVSRNSRRRRVGDIGDITMKWIGAAAGSAALFTLATLAGGLMMLSLPQEAKAVVYCKAVGVPKGCVVRPAPAAIYCTRPGYPVGCVGRPAAAAARCTRPGLPAGCAAHRVRSPVNRGGPVNRIGLR